MCMETVSNVHAVRLNDKDEPSQDDNEEQFERLEKSIKRCDCCFMAACVVFEGSADQCVVAMLCSKW